ncbi:C-type lectin 1-like [Ruditapes philippinarum]|uniref:C-type lectin 1-like n=1 Tax=Ruditapes philippinarum TaxID=129788 RepID=UPI00295AA9F5|nr:C-type lectin 1-like [Ruditapes philippinarum]
MFEINSMCYHYIEKPDIQVTFDIAEPDCRSRKGHLLTIKDNATQEELKRQLANVGDVHTILIGLKRDGGVWKWVTGENLLYNNWKEGEICSNCDCAKLKLREGGVWESVPCQTADWFTAYVCQYAPVDGSNAAYNVHPVQWSVLSLLSTLTAAVVLTLRH